jgi:single-strand DNA-binding protein
MNVVILRGCLSSAPARRDLPSGDTLVTFEVTTRSPDGPAETVPVAWPNAPRRAAELPPGAEVVVTGRVRRRFFTAGGATASSTEVLADVVLPAGHARRVDTAVRKSLDRAEPLLVAP